MKTEVEMKRELFGVQISQKSKSEFFSATELVKAGNKWRIAHDKSNFNITEWFKHKSTKEFITDLEEKFGKVYIKGKKTGRNSFTHTWVHPLLFIDLALAISPKLKIEVYQWLFDHLVKNRNDSGNSYKKMAGCLYVRHSNKKTFSKFIASVAKMIQSRCKVIDWQQATEEQLKLRNKLHYDIALIADLLNNNTEAVRLAFVRNAPGIGE